MISLVRPELPTASVGSSQAPTAAVDNSAPSATRPQSTYKSGKAVQTNGATSPIALSNANTALCELRWAGTTGLLIETAGHDPVVLLTATIARDPSDDHVLATALPSGADLIVSGDAHLLD